MGFGLEWINDIIQAILTIFPRPVIIRATHGGIKWRYGKDVKELKPGWHIWWPLVTEVETIVTARQTYNTPTQALMTKDKHEVVVGAVVVYSINDIAMAIGQRNWDVDTTVNDITQAAIVKVITQWNLNDILIDMNEEVKKQLTLACKKEMRQFGVYVHKVALTDFSTCTSFNLLGAKTPIQHTVKDL